jgi:hypothetical protein
MHDSMTSQLVVDASMMVVRRRGNGLKQDPLNTRLLAFVNRCATQIKVPYFDRGVWCAWAKRLEAGHFIGD